jgi:metallo-beta-lactamase family protein
MRAQLWIQRSRQFLLDEQPSADSVDQSKAINNVKGARIIIAASGMVNGGRVLHHLSRLISTEETTVLFVGYQAEGSRGRTIQSGAPSVRIFGYEHQIRASVQTISSLSAHGDRDELLRWLGSSNGTPSQVFTVHGENESCIEFARTIEAQNGFKARPAEYLEEITF